MPPQNSQASKADYGQQVEDRAQYARGGEVHTAKKDDALLHRGQNSEDERNHHVVDGSNVQLLGD